MIVIAFVFFFQGSAAHKKLKETITRPRLIRAIRLMSQYHQTSGLEAKHSLDNVFAPKHTYYPYHSLCARFVISYAVIKTCTIA